LGGNRIRKQVFKFKGTGGQSEAWYLEADIRRVKTWLQNSTEAKKNEARQFHGILRQLRREAGLTQLSLAAKTGVCKSAVGQWERGKQYPRPPVDKALAKALDVPLAQLKIPSARERARRPQHNFDGVFRENGVIVGYTIARAARESGIPSDRLHDYKHELPRVFRSIFPRENRLPTQPMVVPGTKRRFETAVRPEHLEALANGIAKILCETSLPRGLSTSEEICDAHAIAKIRDRITVRKLLQALGQSGCLNSKQRARYWNCGGSRWYFPLLFDRKEVNRYLDGRNLLELAKGWDSEPADGVLHQPACASPPPPAQKRAGRPPKEATQELYEFVHDQYYTKDLSARTVLELVNDRFGSGTILEESIVRIYARRFAKKRKAMKC
jgi:transcriptional regulator with XRE-family HTH domain